MDSWKSDETGHSVPSDTRKPSYWMYDIQRQASEVYSSQHESLWWSLTGPSSSWTLATASDSVVELYVLPCLKKLIICSKSVPREPATSKPNYTSKCTVSTWYNSKTHCPPHNLIHSVVFSHPFRTRLKKLWLHKLVAVYRPLLLWGKSSCRNFLISATSTNMSTVQTTWSKSSKYISPSLICKMG